ncbi:hypothetical protein CCAX7_55750 [Capsulimonas corticalis]|uniref:Uncharacterized protein n=1 Tax=Capsulimonas corticalis TaxID=2219043 RepID=A0A402D0V7_9BACT|nr:DUF6368 family protein [Capsulimonas corticalis]BDI33524.1 hypothetical protein CCAX7_55750 [Capsulimonas corticalis]
MGPCYQILLPRAWTDNDEKKLDEVIDAVSAEHTGRDCWVADTRPVHGITVLTHGRSFIIGTSPFDLSDAMHPVVQAKFMAAFGFTPADIAVVICANCKDKVDHVILAELLAGVADLLDGIIPMQVLLPTRDLPQRLQRSVWVNKAAWSECEPYQREMLAGMQGRLVTIPDYNDYWDCHWVSQYADAAFLRWWMTHPSFRMPG